MNYRSKLCLVAAVALAIAAGVDAAPAYASGPAQRFRGLMESKPQSPRKPVYGARHSPPEDHYFGPEQSSSRSSRAASPAPSAPPSPPAKFARSPSFSSEPSPSSYYRPAAASYLPEPAPTPYAVRSPSPASFAREPSSPSAYARGSTTPVREPSPAAVAGAPRPVTAYPAYPAYPRVAPRFIPRRFSPGSVSTSAAVGGGAAAAASSGDRGGSASTAVSGGRGGAAAASSTHHGPSSSHQVDEERFREHYDEPQTENQFASQSGTYMNDGNGLETSSFNRNTKSMESHEDGKEDDDHYYNAQSYGETNDENKRVSYATNDEDVMHTNNMYRSKKSNTVYDSDHNKASRRSGSGVLARDKHSAQYNRDLRKVNEVVNHNTRKEGAGVLDTDSFTSTTDVDEEEEEMSDNHGLGNFVGVDGKHQPRRPSFGARSMSASASGGSGGSAASVASSH